jgi:tryptophan synthase beta subunit
VPNSMIGGGCAEMKLLKQQLEEYKQRVSSIGGGKQALGVFEPVIDQAFLAGAEAGFKAARLAKNGCNVSLDYNEGGGPVYPSIVDFRKDGGESE